MKTAKYLVSPLVMASAFAMAAVPPYHGDVWMTGTATINLEGDCTISPLTITDVGFGVIYDSENVDLGIGLLTQEGDLLALVDGHGPRTVFTRSYENSERNIAVYKGFINITGDNLYESLQQIGCPVATVVPNIRSSFVIVGGAEKDSLSIDAMFSGYTDKDTSCVVNDVTTVCTAGKFRGSLTFKGE